MTLEEKRIFSLYNIEYFFILFSSSRSGCVYDAWLLTLIDREHSPKHLHLMIENKSSINQSNPIITMLSLCLQMKTIARIVTEIFQFFSRCQHKILTTFSSVSIHLYWRSSSCISGLQQEVAVISIPSMYRVYFFIMIQIEIQHIERKEGKTSLFCCAVRTVDRKVKKLKLNPIFSIIEEYFHYIYYILELISGICLLQLVLRIRIRLDQFWITFLGNSGLISSITKVEIIQSIYGFWFFSIKH